MPIVQHSIDVDLFHLGDTIGNTPNHKVKQNQHQTHSQTNKLKRNVETIDISWSNPVAQSLATSETNQVESSG